MDLSLFPTMQGLPEPSSHPPQRRLGVGLALAMHGVLLLGLWTAAAAPASVQTLGGTALFVSLEGVPSLGQGGAVAAPPPQESQEASTAPEPEAIPHKSPTARPQPAPRPQPVPAPKPKPKSQIHKKAPSASVSPPTEGPQTSTGEQGLGGSVAGGDVQQVGQPGGGTEGQALMQFNKDGGPRFLRQVPPRYPDLARRLGKQGDAVIEVQLSAAGKVLDAKIISADREDFGKAALASILASTYAPAQVDGKPVGCIVPIRVEFVLRDP